MSFSWLQTLRTKPARWWVESLLLPVVVWLALFKTPHQPGVGLDDSWSMALAYGAEHGWLHGRDFVFTYGPLGHLTALTYAGHGFWPFMIWQLASNAVFAWLTCRFAKELPRWRRVVFFAFLLLWGSIYADAVQMLQIAVVALFLTRRTEQSPRWLVFGGAVFGVFALIKFTNLMLCAFIAAVLAALWLYQGRRAAAAWLVGSFVGTFFGLWVAIGQSPTTIPAFLRYSWEISNGYVDAMGVFESPLMFLTGAGALLAVISYALLFLASQRDKIAAFATCLILGGIVFINWKHGFVRADGHVLSHFTIVLMVACTFPALTGDNDLWPAAKNGALACAGLLALAGFYQVAPHLVYRGPGGFNRRLHDAVLILADLPAYQQQLDEKLRQLKFRASQPGLREIVRDAPVDHLSDDQAYSFISGLNLHPRPPLQGYTVYTEALNRLSESHYLSERAPQFVLSRFTTIDGRLLTQDDSLVLRHVFQNYRYLTESGGLVVFEKSGEPIVPPEAGLPPVRRRARFGERVEVPDFGGRPVWVTIDIQPTFAGRLRKFFYKLPHAYLEATETSGRTERFLLVRQIAGTTGFTLSPLLRNSGDVLAFQNGGSGRQVRSFTLTTAPSGDGWFRPEAEIEFRALNPFRQGMVERTQRLIGRFPMLERLPDAGQAHAPILLVQHVDRMVVMLHAPGRLEYVPRTADRSLELDFGILPAATQPGNSTDGVVFLVEWHAPDGTVHELFRRPLTPATEKSDRGTQHAKIDLRALSGGRLVVRTDPGPAGNISCDWAYIERLAFQTAP